MITELLHVNVAALLLPVVREQMGFTISRI